MNRSRSIAFAALLLLSAGGFTPALGQAAGLSGQVIDAGTGEAVVEATVHIVSSRDSAAVVTDDNGGWHVTALQPGDYQVRVQRIGYAERRVDAVLPRSGPLVISVAPSARPPRARNSGWRLIA